MIADSSLGGCMVRAEPQDRMSNGETLYGMLTLWASTASISFLACLTVLSGVGAAVVYLTNVANWPVSGLLVTLGAIAAWGLIDQEAAHPLPLTAVIAQWALVVVGSVAAAAGALGILFRLMGPAPVL